MGILDFFNKPQQVIQPATTSISSMYTQPVQIVKGTVNPNKITMALRQLESSGGKDPDIPKNKKRVYITVPANGNEKARIIPYDTFFAGEYGLTPLALAHLASSKIDRNAATSTFTKFGRPLIPGKDPKQIQQELMTVEGAGRLANEFFMDKKADKKDYTPQTLTNDYINNYVGKGSISDTPANRARVLKYFQSIVD